MAYHRRSNCGYATVLTRGIGRGVPLPIVFRNTAGESRQATMYQIIGVYPPSKPGKILARIQLVFTKQTFVKAEDYNNETKKSYTQAEGVVMAGFKINASVIVDSNKNPMLVGTILPPFDVGRQIAAEAIAKLNEQAAAG